MYKLFDFKCLQCSFVFEELVASGEADIVCNQCGGSTEKVFIKTATPVGCDSFNPHYDIQLGQHFSSASEKKQYLERTGKVQESGHLSPKTSGKGRTICTKDQYRSMERKGGVERFVHG